jgi:hypothetical protein
MMQSPLHAGRRRLLVALLVAGLILTGSAVIAVVTRNGGLRAGSAYAEGTILELPGGASTAVSITGNNLEVDIGTSSALTSGSILLESEGFHRDFRSAAGTYGLRLDAAGMARKDVKRVTLVVPENGSLTMTLVGDARVVLDQARLKGLKLTGASSALEMDASGSGSLIDSIQIENVTGGFSATGLGNLDMTSLVIGNVTGTYDIDLSGSLARHCDVSLRTVVGNGTLRIPERPGALLSVRNVLGRVISSGFVAGGEQSYLNSSAAGGADRQLMVNVGSVVGQIQLVEVQQ